MFEAIVFLILGVLSVIFGGWLLKDEFYAPIAVFPLGGGIVMIIGVLSTIFK